MKKRNNSSSLRKRIHYTYALIYMLVCIFILGVFFALTTYRSLSVFDDTGAELTDLIASEALRCAVGSDGMRVYLNSLRNSYGIREIYIVDPSGSLISGTTRITDAIDPMLSERDLMVKYFPQFSGIRDGAYFYITETVLDSKSVRLIISFDASGVFSSHLYSLRTLVTCLLFGFFVFVLAGNYRMNRILAPIREMTEVTKNISAENLDLRLDVSHTEAELNELAVTINEMIDRIQISYDKQKRFVSDVSHELRTPIAVISGYGSMLRRWGKDDEEILNESIDSIISECENMKELVEKLLFLTRHDNDTVNFDMAPVDISELVATTVREEGMVHPDFTFDLECESGIIFNADETRFRQALRIFLDNAVKYSGDSTLVEVTLRQLGAGFVLSVKDHGIGISKEDLPNIFERFYRADTSRTKETGGYGLGLSIARIIVENHSGIIKVRTKEGEGSEFSMIFRNINATAPTAAAENRQVPHRLPDDGEED